MLFPSRPIHSNLQTSSSTHEKSTSQSYKMNLKSSHSSLSTANILHLLPSSLSPGYLQKHSKWALVFHSCLDSNSFSTYWPNYHFNVEVKIHTSIWNSKVFQRKDCYDKKLMTKHDPLALWPNGPQYSSPYLPLASLMMFGPHSECLVSSGFIQSQLKSFFKESFLDCFTLEPPVFTISAPCL